MDKDNVTGPMDISAAAAAMRSAPPVQPVTTPAADLKPGTPDAADDVPTDADVSIDPEGEASTDDSPDGVEEPATRSDAQKQWDAEMATKKAAHETEVVKFEERKRLADDNIKRLLEDPEEYARMREKLGIGKPAAAPVTPAQPAAAAGPDPIEAPETWRDLRVLAYQRHFRKEGKAVELDVLEEAAERDLIQAQIRANQAKTKELEAKLAKASAPAQPAPAAVPPDADRQAAALDKKLTALYTKFPAAKANQEDVEAAIYYALHKGQQPDLEAIVSKIAGRDKAAVARWSKGKQALATGARAASGGGGATASPVSVVKTLPAEASSIMEIGRMGREGKLK